MADRIRTFDWDATPLGPIRGWPRSLRTAVGMMLAMPDPATILWGPAHVQLYNDAYVSIARNRHPALLGRPVAEGWPDAYANVIAPLLAETAAGRAVRLRGYAVTLHAPHGGLEERHFDTAWSPIHDETDAVAGALQTLTEVSDARRAREALRASEERQAFLLKLSDALRQLEEPTEIQRVSCGLLRHEIGAMRVAWGEMMPDGVMCVAMGEDMAEGVYSLAGRTWDWNEFDPAGLAALKRGETIYREDVQSADDLAPELKATFATYGFQAFIIVPLVRQGRLEAFLLAHWEGPRRFTPTEITWMEETTERTAASVQRAQAKVALQESEARLSAAFESVPAGIGVVGTDGAVIVANEHLRRYLPSGAIPSRDPSILPRWRAWDEQGRPLPPDEFPGARALRGERVVPGQEMLFTQADGQEVWTQVASVPIRDAAGRVTAASTVINDIDELKRASQALRESGARQDFLLKLSDALRPLTDALAIQETATRLLGEHLGARAVNYGLVEAVDGVDHYVIDRAYVAPGCRSTVGRWPVDDFPGFTVAMRAGETMAVDHVASAPNLMPRDKAGLASTDTAAFLMAPLAKNGRPTAMLCIVEDKPRTWNSAETALVQEVAERTWAAVERARAEAALRESEARQRALIEGVPQLVWRAVDCGHWTWASPQWTTFTGQSDADSRGLGWLDTYHPDDRDAAMDIWRAAESIGRLEIDARIYHAPDGRYRWFQTRATAVRDEQGRIVEWLGTSTDVDDLRAYQERQEVMVAELQHRTRNLLGVVRSISGQTMRNSATLAEFEAAFNHRLGALSRVQGLLSCSDDAPITLGALLHSELDALGAEEVSERIAMRGPEVRLRKGTVQTLALALHELATNARKYGALANGKGRLLVTWWAYTNEAGRRVALEWREIDLDRAREEQSPVTKPGGYGRELIERALPYVLQARTTYELGETELTCTIDLPLVERPRTEEHG